MVRRSLALAATVALIGAATASGHASCLANPACVVPNDPQFANQWSLQNEGTGADVDAAHAWVFARGEPDVTVAVVDTGVDAAHPELAGRVAESVSIQHASDTDDHFGHGTASAGIVGAIANNGQGVAGVDWNARLLNVKLPSDDTVTAPCTAIADAIRWATDHGAQVISVTYSDPYGCFAEDQATDYAWTHGALVVASAGNRGNTAPSWPSADPHVIGVAATDRSDHLLASSARGPWVMLAAPGADIPALLPSHPNASGSQDYGTTGATSAAAPLVAGAAAVVWPVVADANGDGRKNDDVAQRLFDTADAIPGTGTDVLHGRVNLCRAVAPDPGSCAAGPPQAAAAEATPTADSSAPAPAPAHAPAAVARPRGSARGAASRIRAVIRRRYGRVRKTVACRRASAVAFVCRARVTRRRATRRLSGSVRYGPVVRVGLSRWPVRG